MLSFFAFSPKKKQQSQTHTDVVCMSAHHSIFVRSAASRHIGHISSVSGLFEFLLFDTGIIGHLFVYVPACKRHTDGPDSWPWFTVRCPCALHIRALLLMAFGGKKTGRNCVRFFVIPKTKWYEMLCRFDCLKSMPSICVPIGSRCALFCCCYCCFGRYFLSV